MTARARALRLVARLAIAFFIFLLAALPALAADLTKLDPLARTTYEMIAGYASLEDLNNARKSVDEYGRLEAFVEGSVTPSQLQALGAYVNSGETGDTIFTAVFSDLNAVDAVTDLAGVEMIYGGAPVDDELNVSVRTTLADQQRGNGPNFAGLNGAGILIGAVDSGVDWKHDDFKNPDGTTRLISLWDQSDAGGPNPAGFRYGSEWAPADMNGATPRCREVDRSGHGSHVLSIAGGDGSATGGGAAPAFTLAGMAPKADLIFVKRGGGFNVLATRVIDGVRYIFKQATDRNNQKCVVNLSLGTQYGSHDGQSVFERGLNALVGNGRIIVKSAGNDNGKALHAEALAVNAGAKVKLVVGGATVLGGQVAIDGYYDGPGKLEIIVKPPVSAALAAVAFGTRNAAFPGTQTASDGYVYVENGVTLTHNGARQIQIELVTDAANRRSINGTWEFTFKRTEGPAEIGVDLWRYNTSFNPAVTADFTDGNQPNRRMVTEPGNAPRLITVAAYTTRTTWTDCNARERRDSDIWPAQTVGRIATFSSRGPTRDGRQKPDIAAPGAAIAAVLSADTAPTCPVDPADASPHLPGLKHTINLGTSMAAPHVAGACALILQTQGNPNPDTIRNYLRDKALVDLQTGAVPNATWGHGKLRLGDLTIPSVTVVHPNGGEAFNITQQVFLTFSAIDPYENSDSLRITIKISRNGPGGPFVAITPAEGIGNFGVYEWTVTGPATDRAVMLVEAVDGGRNLGFDTSDHVFSINDMPVPVELSGFSAAGSERGLVLTWTTAFERDHAGFNLYRSLASGGPFERVNRNGLVTGSSPYTFADPFTAPGSVYYRLGAVALDGREMTLGLYGPYASAGAAELPRVVAFQGAAPNPFNPATTLRFDLPGRSEVSLAIYDIQGRLVRTLAHGALDAGQHELAWDGRADSGAPTASGVYFARFAAPSFAQTQRLVLLK